MDSIDDALETTGNEETNLNFELVEELMDLEGNATIGGEIIEEKRDEIIEIKNAGAEDESAE
eukprot:TRINITY_DN222_c0_g2_i2.p4 TRINITY_DN222_c0_g2~~TRINITY_DN222_c0_g2_i2.p4  ORF type:complete len:62 (-),score=20.94 TRINITY_DN222_c0_g2_i2:68-253(-)